MDISTSLFYLLIIVFALMLVTNIIVQVLKQITWDKIPTQLLAFIVAMLLTLIVFFAYADIASINLEWYYAAAAVAVGFFVAFSAMFGFEKFREILYKFKEMTTGI